MVPWTGSTPRRARYLIPKGTPRRVEVTAACAVAILVAHLLLAQVTLVLAVIFAAVSKASRWRLWWLLGPAGAGLAWTLAAGPEHALAGFTAGPSSILWHLGGGHLAGRGGHPLAGFSGAPGWLPRQLPVALVAGAVEAALIGWLDWLHTDEWAVPPPRPGLVAAAHRAVAVRAVRAGGVVTREGVALGMVPATGALAELRWTEVAHGTLIVGAAAQDVTLAGLQVVHAALRRHKPVIVLDTGDAAIARALDTACAATGVPLLADGGSAAGRAAGAASARGSSTVGTRARGAAVGARAGAATGAGASGLWGRASVAEREPGDQAAGEAGDRMAGDHVAGDRVIGNLGRVVRERSAALVPAGTAELAGRACAELASLAADLRRIGVDGDALVWAPRAEQVPAHALAVLLRGAAEAGLAVIIGTTSLAAVTELRGLAGSALIFRVADPDLAAGLAALGGTRLLPRSHAAQTASAALAAPVPGGLVSAAPVPGGTVPGGTVFGGQAPAAPTAGGPVADLVPGSAIAAQTLLELGQAEFVLAVSRPRPRLIATGRMVPARLPRTGRRGARS
jgi:hypothetical protein